MNPQLTFSQRQWLHSSVGRASHRYREVTGSNPVEVLNFFQASLRNCTNCVHCDDHFFIFISFPLFIYDLFHISLTPNIVGSYMLRPFAHPVACCFAKFETGQTFSPLQTDATFLANNSQHCRELLCSFSRSLRFLA